MVTLRTREDSDEIRRRALAAEQIVVVGGGWIGAEVAASLRELGRDVTFVVPGAMPLVHPLGVEAAAVFRDAHLEHGVRLLTGRRITAIEGRERAEAAVTDDGSRHGADLVVVGVGAEPRTELARSAGLALARGVLVDERLESSVPGIFAAGDVAEAMHPFYGRRVRVEHRDNAKRQGRAAAAGMLGLPVSYDRIPFFYSDQFEIGMEYTGFAPAWDEVVFRGDRDGREFISFWLRDGTVVAGMNVNTWDVAPDIERLVRARARVDRRRLADPDVALDEVAAVAVAA